VQAQAFLDSSAAGRQAVVDAVSGCENGNVSAAAAIAGLQEGVRNREYVRDGLRQIRVSDAYQLFVAMDEAMSYSIEADYAYQNWVTQVGCFPQDADVYPEHARGDQISQSASAAKRNFLSQWNPLAAQYGLRQYAESEI
jgi:hypothetical protein